jgi:serine/threonine protein kinase
MAPEIFERKGFNEKVDEWAAGILMFNMLTGCEPFCSGSDSDFKDDLLNKEINFNKIKNERLRELNRKLLVRNAEKRISAKEALKEIQFIKQDLMTINLMNNINNNKSDYFDFITKKISLISIS